MTLMRLDKFLSNMGKGSRKEIKKFLLSGEVLVNETVIKNPEYKINPEEDKIKLFSEEVSYYKEHYLMMNKPKGVISATEDLREKTVLDLLSGEYKKFDLFPAGRLDKDTTGLLLLTTDGKLAHEILSPKKHVTKTYIAVLDKEAQQSDKEAFLEGIVLDDGYKTKPGILEISDSDKHVCTVFISEGKFHQIKRMFADRGKKVLELKRIKMGGLCLDESLLPGEYRELSMEEVEKLFKKE